MADVDAMNFAEYQNAAYTAIQSHADSKEEEMHWALGLGEEAGEVLGVIKHRHYGGEFSVTDLVEELGDTLWHIAAMCTAFGIKMDDVAKFNLTKLSHRYPTGSFNVDRSNQRHKLTKQFRETEEAKAIMSRVNRDYLNSRGKGK